VSSMRWKKATRWASGGLYEKFWEVSAGAGSPGLLSMLITVRLEPLLRAKSQLPTAKSKGSDPPEARAGDYF